MAQAAVRYDRAGDQHYDVASALIKSMRGSDVDAALHYLARMLEAGEDPRFIARRIVIAASEDVGMADPTALQTAVAATQAVRQIGMPEARIILAQAVVHLATAPKSNASYLAINAAIADMRAGRGGAVPAHLRDSGYAGAERLGHGGVPVRPRRRPRGRRPAVPPGRSAGPGLLPADRPRVRAVAARLGLAQGAVGEPLTGTPRARGAAARQWPPWGSTPPPNAPSKTPGFPPTVAAAPRRGSRCWHRHWKWPGFRWPCWGLGYLAADTPSLLPRPWYFQGLISGILALIFYAVGLAIASAVRAIGRWSDFRMSVNSRAKRVAGIILIVLLAIGTLIYPVVNLRLALRRDRLRR